MHFIYPLVFLSGLTGLVYQVTWQKYLELLLGSHALSATLVLAVFFLCLSLGGKFIGHFADSFFKTNKLKGYGWIEIAIGIYALFSPNWIGFLANHVFFDSPSVTVQLVMGGIFTTLFIGFPTFLMGGTIPLLTQGLSQEFKESHTVHARIYAINTGGAFLGAVSTTLYLLENWGLPLTLLNAGVLNLLIGVVSLGIASTLPGESLKQPPQLKESSQPQIKTSIWVISFLSGLSFFLLEGLVLRMAGLSLGSSIYTYGMIVSSFILAIALGAFASKRIKNPEPKHLLIYFLLLATSLILLYLSVPYWPLLSLRLRFLIQPILINFNTYWLMTSALYILILLIPVGLMGSQLPLLFGIVRDQKEALVKTTGKLYSINALGCVCGAILSYLAFLKLTASQVFLWVIFLSLASALLSLLSIKLNLKEKKVAAVVCILLVMIPFLPKWKTESFNPGLFLYTSPGVLVKDFKTSYQNIILKDRAENKIIWSKFDPNTWTVVTEGSQGRNLLVNGKIDAGAGDAIVRALNALIPTLLVPEPKNIFITGLGAGLSTSILGSLPSVESLEVAEISSSVIESLRFFDAINRPYEKYQAKTIFTVGDAYQVLKNREKLYDLMVTEPSNPWVTGVEKLFTIEFIEQAYKRLSPTGIYAQWFPLFNMTEEALLAILKNFSDIFPWVTLWNTQGQTFLLLGSKQKPTLDLLSIQKRFEINQDLFEKYGLKKSTQPLSLQVLSHRGVKTLAAFSLKTHTVENPSIQYEANRAVFINQVLNMDQFQSDRMKVYETKRNPTDSVEPLLYEELGLHKNLDFLSSSIEVSQKFAGPLFSRRRLSWHLYQISPSHSLIKNANPDRVKAMNVWSKNKVSLFFIELKNIDQAVNLYKTFWEMRDSDLPIPRLPDFSFLTRPCEKEKTSSLQKNCHKLYDDLIKLIRGEKFVIDEIPQDSSPASSSPSISPS